MFVHHLIPFLVRDHDSGDDRNRRRREAADAAARGATRAERAQREAQAFLDARRRERRAALASGEPSPEGS